MILAAPFLLPISIPGTGVVVGFIVLFISLSIMFDKIYLVPEILLKREMSHVNLIKILNATFKMLKYLESWMDKKGFNYIDQFKGKLSQEKTSHPDVYERLQFMKYFSKIK